jgi:hypothetical protein
MINYTTLKKITTFFFNYVKDILPFFSFVKGNTIWFGEILGLNSWINPFPPTSMFL